MPEIPQGSRKVKGLRLVKPSPRKDVEQKESVEMSV